jgi:hypothetical protein
MKIAFAAQSKKFFVSEAQLLLNISPTVQQPKKTLSAFRTPSGFQIQSASSAIWVEFK